MVMLKGAERGSLVMESAQAERLGIVAGRVLAPGPAAQHRLASGLEQPVHVQSVERLALLLREGVRNEGDIVLDAVALAEHVELVEIADALGADQRRHRAADDLERTAIHGL